MSEHSTEEIRSRLEEIRAEIRAERISTGEIIELQDLAEHIEPSDVELLEWSGVPEFTEAGSGSPLTEPTRAEEISSASIEELERAELEESRPRSSGVFEHLDRVSEYVAELEERAEELETSMRGARISLYATLEELGGAREEIASLEAELEESRGALEISEDRTRATLEAGRSRIQHYSSALTEERLSRRITESRLEAELESTRSDLNLNRSRVSYRMREIEELTRELRAREAELSSMRGES